jgi:pimeloyl-ACP methyl ester carboxylesterase
MDAAVDTPASRYTHNGDVRLHYLDVRPSSPGPAVVVVPGLGEEAADHVELLGAVAPRRAIAVDIRGRGASEVATHGYRFEDHVGDLVAIVADAAVDAVHVVTYSRGTTYGLGWALRHLERVVSITVAEYPAVQIVPPTALADYVATRTWRQRPMAERMSAAAVEAMVADAETIELWSDLTAVRQPMLLIRGGATGAMAGPEVEARYRRAVPHLEVACFDESGHDLWSPDPDRFAATVRAFLDRVDPR